ncbi:MAG: glycosyltransferase, partial [Pseudomonadota bacterium]
MKVVYFGHNSGDAAVRRRVVSLERAGCSVTGFMPHREGAAPPAWENVDLGETRDNDYGHRVRSIFSGARVVSNHAERVAGADLMIARNLDMLALACLARRRLGSTVPLIYECLDVHHKLTGAGMASKALRALEARLLRNCALVVVSSPGFEREYFAKHHEGRYKAFLAENRLIEGDAFPPRPGDAHPRSGPLRIGWFGNLRCSVSLDLLLGIAERFRDEVEIVLRGYPAPGVFPDFEGLLAGHANVTYHGRYKAPQDLEAIYADVDVVWAGDWYETGANSLWLLPNRIYEGGYFGTPALAPFGTETARWLADKDAGFLIDEPVGEALTTRVAALISDRGPIAAKRAALLALPRDVFVEGPGSVREMIAAAGV